MSRPRRFTKYYNVLGLEKGASFSQSKTAYREMIKQWHPDLHSGEDAHRTFAERKATEINQAFQLLEEHQYLHKTPTNKQTTKILTPTRIINRESFKLADYQQVALLKRKHRKSPIDRCRNYCLRLLSPAIRLVEVVVTPRY